MSLALMLKTIGRRFRGSSEHVVSARALTITCQGKTINREELFKYTNGRFLVNENEARDRRYRKFDIDRLCAIAAYTGAQHSPVHTVVKMEGGFSKALLLRKEDGSEIIAKIPCPIAGPPKYTTASEVAVLKYLHAHTQVPVPKVLAWNCDPSNPVGAEYIIMEKAPGKQLVGMWDELSDWDQLCIVKQLSKLEGEMTSIQFPASGSLYFCKSMSENDTYITLENDARCCIGPSCERGWFDQSKTSSLHSRFNRGPWPNLSSFGIALVERETARIEQTPPITNPDLPHGSLEEQIAMLKLAKDVISRLDRSAFVKKVSEPVLWHTDLHMGNIYVSYEGEGTAKIASIIDWQSIVVAPLFLQAQFPEFLSVDEDYTLGPKEFPKLPQNYEEMDAKDKERAEDKLKIAKLSKAYELSTGFQNNQGYKALHIPSFLREIFVRSGEISEEGVTPLRACLIEVSKAWDELELVGNSPLKFSDEDLHRHKHEFKKYHETHDVMEFAKKWLSTDVEGWVSPRLDFAMMQRENEKLLDWAMHNSSDFNKSPDEIRRIWPYLDRS